jgi:hypothetical protein
MVLYSSLHYISHSLHYVYVSFRSLHYISLHYISLCYISSRYISLHYICNVRVARNPTWVQLVTRWLVVAT